MSKNIFQIVLFVAIAVVIALTLFVLSAKDVWAAKALENYFKKVTGFQAVASGVHVDLGKGIVSAEKVQILNPEGYSEPVFLSLEKLNLEAAPGKGFMGFGSDWKMITGVIRQIVVERKKDGSLNLREMTLLQPSVVEGLTAGSLPASHGKIHRVELEYGKVIFREITPEGQATDSEIDFKGRREVLGSIAHPEVIFYAGITKVLGSLNRGSLGLPRAGLQQAILRSTGYDPRPVQQIPRVNAPAVDTATP